MLQGKRHQQRGDYDRQMCGASGSVCVRGMGVGIKDLRDITVGTEMVRQCVMGRRGVHDGLSFPHRNPGSSYSTVQAQPTLNGFLHASLGASSSTSAKWAGQ